MADNLEKQNENNDQEYKGLAMEMLKEIKIQAKRWMVAFFVVLGLWAGTIVLFVWYINQYEFISYDINSGDGGNANYIGNDGDIYNGTSPSENEEEKEQ